MKKKYSEHDEAGILRSLEDGFLRADTDGRIVMANEAIANLFGYTSPEEMLGVSMKNHYAIPEDRDRMIKEVKKNGKVSNYELELRRTDGSRFWSLNNIKTYRDENGTLLGTEGVIRDITDMHMMQKQLDHTNKLLASIRRVNQLITAEKDTAILLQAICHTLTENRGYYNVWIMLLDERGMYEAVYQAGLGKEFKRLEKKLKQGDLPTCIEKALKQKDVLIMNNPFKECSDCPLALNYENRGGIAAPIIHNERLFGFIVASVPEEFMIQSDVDLFEEVAADIGLALHNIMLETSRARVIEELKAANEQLMASEQQLRAAHQQLTAHEQQLRASNQQLTASEQQLRASNQQLTASEQQLKAHEAALRRNLERLSLGEQIAGLGYFEHNWQTGEDFCSEGVYALLGIDPEESDGDHIHLMKFVHPDDLQEVEIYFTASLKDHTDIDIEFRVMRSDENTVYIHGVGKHFFDKNGNPLNTIAKVQDITDRKILEKTLADKTQLLNNTGAMARVGGWEVDVATNTLTWSEETYRIHEIPMDQQPPVEEAIGFFHPDDRPILQEALKNAVEKGEPYDLVLRFITARGKHLITHTICRPEMENGRVIRLKGTFQDVTDWKKAEEQLQAANQQLHAANQQLAASEQQLKAANQQLAASENKIRTVIDNSPFPVAVVDVKDEHILYWSKSAKTIFGHDPKTTKEWYALAYPDENYRHEVIKRWKPFLQKARESGTVVNTGEYNITCADGSVKICELYAQFIPGNLVVTLHDITEKKKTEEAVRESEERFQIAMNASHDGLFDWNLETNEIYYSPGWKRMLGYEDHGLPNDFSVWEKTTDPEDVKKSWEIQQQLISKQIDRFLLEFKMKHKDGHWIDVLSRAKAIFNEKGKAVRIVGTHVDITKRKKAEETIRTNEEKFRSLFEQHSLGIYIHDLDGNIVDVNPNACEQLGYSKRELLTLNVFDFHPKETRKNLPREEVIQQWKQWSPGKQHIIEAEHQRKDGTILPVQITTGALEYGNTHQILAIVQDISERKKSEEEMLAHQRHLSVLKDIGMLATSTLNLKKLLNSILDGALQAVGTSVGMIFVKDMHTGQLFWGTAIGLSEAFESEFENSPIEPGEGLTGRISETGEAIYIQKDSSHDPRIAREVVRKENLNSFIGVPIYAENEIIGVLNILSRAPRELNEHDVALVSAVGAHVGSAVKNARLFNLLQETKETLQESDERYRGLVDTVNEGVAIYEVINDGRSGSDYIIREFNQFALKHENLQKEDVVGKSLKDIRPNIDEYGLIDIFRKVWISGESSFYPAKVYVDENYTNYYENRVFRLPSGEIVAVYNDVTERESARLELMENEAKLKNIIENSTNLFYTHSVDHQLKFVSPQVREILGYEPEEAGKRWTEFVTDNPINEKGFKLTEKAITTGERQPTYELELRRKDGKKIMVEVREAPLVENGNVVSIVGSLTDITDRKQADEALKKSEKRYRSLTENIPVGIFRSTPRGKIISANTAAAQIYGYDSIEELLHVPASDFYSDNNPRQIMLAELKQKEILLNYITEENKKDGSKIWVSSNYRLIKSDESEDEEFYIDGTVIDITDRKKTEELLLLNNTALNQLNQTALEFTNMSSNDNLEAFIAKQLKEISGAEVALFSEYDPVNKTVTPKHIEVESRFLKKAVTLLGTKVENIHSVVSDKKYRELTRKMINVRDNLYIASFGAIPSSVASAIQTMLNVDHFVGLAYMLDGELYGTSLIGIKKGQPDPPMEILMNFIHMASASLRRHRAEQALRKSEEKVRISEQRLRDLSQHLQQAHEEERARLARELHDQLGQALTALRIDLSRLKPQVENDTSTFQTVEGMESVLDTIDADVERIQVELRPGMLDDLGLLDALEWQVNDFQKRSGIECVLKTSIDASLLDQDLSLTLFRIVQEALTNISKHADAASVQLVLKSTRKNIFLTIEDDGRGVRPEELEKKGSFGLIGMRERINLQQGEMRITGVMGEGTSLKVKIPLRIT